MRSPNTIRTAFIGAMAVVVCSVLPVHAQVDVDLELVLAVDVSGSMDSGEAELQRNGYVDAFRHPDVIRAIETGLHGRIAVSYVEWAGTQHQALVVPWRIVADADSADVFAHDINRLPIRRHFGTSISSALEFAAAQFADGGARGFRRAIDVSGDGPNNMGAPVVEARDALVRRGIAINGLPVMIREGIAAGRARIPNLDVYFEDCVIGGPGAFIVPVRDRDGFGQAIRRKLVLEIAGLPPRVMQVAESVAGSRVDCMIGEKNRGNWILNDP